MIQKSISTSVVVILDCSYCVSAKVSKGHEEDAAKIGRTAIDEKSRKLPLGQGKYIYFICIPSRTRRKYYQLPALQTRFPRDRSEPSFVP
jgi:hypothetical protein